MMAPVILVVEDNARNLKLVRDVLQHHGFQIIEAETGLEGVEQAASHRPDLILLDIQLPDIDGISALARLRRNPLTATTPVIALTAFAMNDDRKRFMAAGFDGYLPKPIDIRALPELVQAWIDQAKPASAERHQ